MSEKKAKRGLTSGFDSEATPKRIKLMKKNVPAEHWRDFKEQCMKFTYIRRSWTYKCTAGEEMTYTDITVCPFGMKEHMIKLLSDQKCHCSYKVLPNDVKENFAEVITQDQFDKAALSIAVCHERDKWYHNFMTILQTLYIERSAQFLGKIQRQIASQANCS